MIYDIFDNLIGLRHGGSSTVHIYTQTVHRTTVKYTFTHKQYTVQQYSTHLHTDSTQNNSKVHIYTQTVHRTTQ